MDFFNDIEYISFIFIFLILQILKIINFNCNFFK